MARKAFIKSAASGSLKGDLEYCDDPIVLSDVVGNPASSIVDATFTRMLDYNFVQVLLTLKRGNLLTCISSRRWFAFIALVKAYHTPA